MLNYTYKWIWDFKCCHMPGCVRGVRLFRRFRHKSILRSWPVLKSSLFYVKLKTHRNVIAKKNSITHIIRTLTFYWAFSSRCGPGWIQTHNSERKRLFKRIKHWTFRCDEYHRCAMEIASDSRRCEIYILSNTLQRRPSPRPKWLRVRWSSQA